MAEPFSICYLDGEYLPLREARVSPLDRAFLYGDAVYEVMPVYAGRVFRFRQHFERLERSMAQIRMQPVYPRERWSDVCAELVRLNGGGDMYLYIQVTRGAEYGRHHAPLPEIERTVFGFAAPLPVIAPEKLERGVDAITAQDTRWERCDIKSTALLANVLLKQQAIEANAQETILLRDGLLTEGASTTVHVVIDGEIRRPSRSHQLLPGTTQDVISELAGQHHIPCRYAAITAAELRNAAEIFITAATIGSLPVTRLDGKPVGAGMPGPLWKQLYRLFEDYKRKSSGH